MEAAIKFRWSGLSHIYLKTFIYVVIYGCAGSSLLHVSFLWLQQAGAILHCGGQTSHSTVFSCGAPAQNTGASVVVHGLRCLAACGIFPDQGSSGILCTARQTLNSVFLTTVWSLHILHVQSFFFFIIRWAKSIHTILLEVCVCVCVYCLHGHTIHRKC